MDDYAKLGWVRKNTVWINKIVEQEEVRDLDMVIELVSNKMGGKVSKDFLDVAYRHVTGETLTEYIEQVKKFPIRIYEKMKKVRRKGEEQVMSNASKANSIFKRGSAMSCRDVKIYRLIGIDESEDGNRDGNMVY